MVQFGGFGGFQAPAAGNFVGGAAGSCEPAGCRGSSRCLELIWLTTLATFALQQGALEERLLLLQLLAVLVEDSAER